MSRGKTPNADAPIPTVVQIPRTLRDRVDRLQWDPVRNKPSYGARTALITTLLERWLRDRKKQPYIEVSFPAETPMTTIREALHLMSSEVSRASINAEVKIYPDTAPLGSAPLVSLLQEKI